MTCPSPTPTTKNGWPSITYPGVEPNSPNAVASVVEESVSAFPAYHPCCSLPWLEILHPLGLQVFVLQSSSRGWCRLVRPSLLGLPGARLWDLGYEHEAQVQLRSKDFMLKVPLMIHIMCCATVFDYARPRFTSSSRTLRHLWPAGNRLGPKICACIYQVVDEWR